MSSISSRKEVKKNMEEKQKKERKSNLLTIRLTDEDGDTLDYLSDHMDSSVTATLTKACRFFLNLSECGVNMGGGLGSDLNGSGTDEKKRKTRVVHVRMMDSDMDRLNTRRDRHGETISDIFRQAIKAYDDFKKGSY